MTHEEAYKIIKDQQVATITNVIFSSESMFAVEIKINRGTHTVAAGLASHPDLTEARKLALIDAVSIFKLRI